VLNSIRDLGLSIARAAIEAVCEAVAELHQHELLHRDINRPILC
jgi:serine/threonine protein kinase